MHRTWLLVPLIACLTFSGTLSLLLGQSPTSSVQQQLRSQYRISSVDGTGTVVRAGSVLVVAQDGLKANPPSAAGCWYNSHKPGNRIKYSTLFEAIVPADLRNQVRLLQVGEKVVVIQLDAKPSEVVLCVQSYTDPPYRAGVTFQFQQKGYVQPAYLKAIQDSIAEVFSLDTASATEGSVPAVAPKTPGEEQVAAPQLEMAAGTYVMTKQPNNRLTLNANGTLVLAQNGDVYQGDYTIEGSSLTMRIGTLKTRATGILQGDTLTDASGSTWVRRITAGALHPPSPPPPAALQLPGTYVSAQTPADQIQLNADNSFSLHEAGQAYQGTFVVTGNAMQLNISGGSATTATIQGNTLTDSGGQTWDLREQSAGTAPAGPLLKNEDIVKMVKARLDDAIIVAKINSSRCQFDMATDALIQLKQSGVSAAVLTAMVGAGR